MAISWYPGHMVTARKEAAETMARTDVVIEILDARIPGASSNPMITQLRLHRQRPGLLVLNKSDLADPAVTPAWRTALSDRENTRVIAISSKRLADVARLIPLAATLAPHRDSPLKPLRLMVMGIPNVGKSTLINALVKRAVARVGDQPAVTRQQSRHDRQAHLPTADAINAQREERIMEQRHNRTQGKAELEANRQVDQHADQ